MYDLYFFDKTVTGDACHGMLNNYLLPGLHDFLDNFNKMYYQNYWAPAHSTNKVGDLFNLEFNNRVIGRRGVIDWSPRSPDLTCMDIYFRGDRKRYGIRSETSQSYRSSTIYGCFRRH